MDSELPTNSLLLIYIQPKGTWKEHTYLHPQFVEEYLQAEIDHGRLAGLYSQSVLPQLHISRFGVIPKSHQPGKWQLIVDLSYPKDHSINDGILGSLCELHYITIDDAIQKIVQLGQGLLNQARVGLRPARAWFLRMSFCPRMYACVFVCVCVCVCVCVRPRGY